MVSRGLFTLTSASPDTRWAVTYTNILSLNSFCFFFLDFFRSNRPTMEINEEKIAMASDFIKQCLLPEFDREIGDQPLERDDFNVFVYGLSQNLRLLFDMISKNEKLLLRSIDETKEFRMNFILLLNEQTSSWMAPFQTDDLSLLKHLDSLVDQYYARVMGDKGVLEKCLTYYKGRLTAAKWKRNIGAVYGYGRFCEVCSMAFPIPTSPTKYEFPLVPAVL